MVTAYKFPTSTIVNFGVTNPDNLFVDDASYADYDSAADYTDQGQFGDFSIPSNASIVGFEVDLKGKFTDGGGGPNHAAGVAVRCAGNIGSTTNIDLSTSDTDYVIGGATDLLGLPANLLASDINTAFNFQVKVQANSLGAPNVLNINSVKIRVYYTQPAISTLTDNFDDNSIDTDKWDTTKTATPSEITEESQSLKVAHVASPAEYNQIYSQGQFDLTGAKMFVKVPDVGNQTLVSHGVIFKAEINSSIDGYYIIASGNVLQAYKIISTVQTQVGSNIAYDAVDHLWWRIQESGGNILFDTSPDSVNWTNRWSVAVAITITSMYIVLQSGAWQDEASGSYGIFDNLNISQVIQKLGSLLQMFQ